MFNLISKAWAYNIPAPVEPDFCDPANIDLDNLQLRHLMCVFNRVYNLAIFVVGAVFVIWMIVSGIRYMTARDNEERVASAKRSLTFAVLGFVLVLAAYTIILTIGAFLGTGEIPIFRIPESTR